MRVNPELRDFYASHIEVEDNVFDIPRRLREIDKDYFVLFNPSNQRYEVHHAGQVDNTYCFTVPYEELDARTIDLVQKTRVENLRKNIEEMEKQNKKVENDNKKKLEDNIEVVGKEVHKYARRHEDKDGGVDKKAFKTRFV